MEYPDILTALGRRWPLVLIVTVLVGGGLTAGALARHPRIFSAECRLVSEGGASIANDPFVTSRQVFVSAGLELQREPSKVADSVTFVPIDDKSLRVRAVSTDPAEAVRTVNAVARAAQKYSRERIEKTLAEASQRADEEVKKTRARIDALRSEPGVTPEDVRSLERRIDAAAHAAGAMEVQVEAARARKDKAAARVRALEAAEHRERETIPTGDEENLVSEPLDRMRTEIASARADLSGRRAALTPENAEVKSAVARLAQLQQEYRAELYRARAQAITALSASMQDADGERIALEARVAKKATELEELTAELRRRDPLRGEAARLERELEALLEMRRRTGEARSAPQGLPLLEDIAEKAEPVDRRVWDAVPLYALGGLVAGLALAAFLGSFDLKIRTERDILRHLDLPCLASVVHTGGVVPLVVRSAPGDPISEKFQTAATVLSSYLADRDFKAVLVCSASSHEGRSTVAANLAAALARKGSRVALVDGDLRAPCLHVIFNVDNTRGFANLLSESEPVDADAILCPTELQTLRILPGGVSGVSPSELLGSARAVEIVKALREKNDVVIFDSPPMSISGDALTLSRLADTSLLVVGARVTDRRKAAGAKQMLANIRADVAGAVLNFAPR